MSTPLSIKFYGERTSDNRCLKFDVMWLDGDNTKEPIYSFVDFINKEITLSFVNYMKKFYNTYTADLCWFCSNNVCLKNNCVCEIHYKKCDWFIEHFNNIVLDDFNSSDLVIESNEEPSSPNKLIQIYAPPKIRRLPAFDNNPLPILQRNINFETDNLEEFEIIEFPDEDDIIFTMI